MKQVDTYRYTSLATLMSLNISGNQTMPDLVENTTVRYTFIALHVVAIVLASAGNGCLIIYILRHWRRTKHNVTACLVLNLAVCDFINATVHPPLKLAELLVHKKVLLTTPAQALLYCQISQYFSACFLGVDFLTMVVISLERLLLICYPLKAKQLLSTRNVGRLLFVIWILVALSMLPIPLAFSHVVTVPLHVATTAFCVINPLPAANGVIYMWFLVFMYYVFPTIIITIAYGRIFKVLSATSPTKHEGNDGITRMMKARKSLAKIMLGVAVIFVISVGPHFMFILMIVMGMQLTRNPIFTVMVLELLTMLSPMLNPLVYTVRAKMFRKGITRSHSEISHDRTVTFYRFSSRRSDIAHDDIEILHRELAGQKRKKGKRGCSNLWNKDNGCLSSQQSPSHEPSRRRLANISELDEDISPASTRKSSHQESNGVGVYSVEIVQLERQPRA